MIKENRAEMKIGEEICTWEEKQVLYSQSIMKGRIPVWVFFFLGENKRKSYRRCAHTDSQIRPTQSAHWTRTVISILQENTESCRRADLTVPLDSCCTCNRNTYQPRTTSVIRQGYKRTYSAWVNISGNGHLLRSPNSTLILRTLYQEWPPRETLHQLQLILSWALTQWCL